MYHILGNDHSTLGGVLFLVIKKYFGHANDKKNISNPDFRQTLYIIVLNIENNNLIDTVEKINKIDREKKFWLRQ